MLAVGISEVSESCSALLLVNRKSSFFKHLDGLTLGVGGGARCLALHKAYLVRFCFIHALWSYLYGSVLLLGPISHPFAFSMPYRPPLMYSA